MEWSLLFAAIQATLRRPAMGDFYTGSFLVRLWTYVEHAKADRKINLMAHYGIIIYVLLCNVMGERARERYWTPSRH